MRGRRYALMLSLMGLTRVGRCYVGPDWVKVAEDSESLSGG